MSTADVVNVIGSVGGVASAIDNLFGPAAGSWEASLVKASFGDVPFGVNSARTHAGRRQAVHAYPFRDDVWVEDMGKLPRQFRVSGFLVENSLAYEGGGVIAQRELLLAACESAGTKTLVHPTFGTIRNVNCLDVEIEERKDLGRVFEFTLSLIISGERQYPNTQQSTSDVLSAAAELLKANSLLDLAREVVADIQYGAEVVSQAVSTVVGYYQTAIGIMNRVQRVFNAVSTLSGSFGRLFGGGNNGYAGENTKSSSTATVSSLLVANVTAASAAEMAGKALQTAASSIGDTDSYGAAAEGFVTALAATAVDPLDRINMMVALCGYSPSATTIPTPIGLAMQRMCVASAAHLRRVTIATLCQAIGDYQPSSQNDAATIQDLVSEILDQEIIVAGDAGDDETYGALCDLRQAAVADLQQRGANLAAMGTFKFNASLPSLALATRIYRDPGREADLVKQVGPVHPAFMPAAFDALVS
jgi:prophage DNA circulation protein